MAEEDEETPAVELGEASPVEGAPIARIASRLSWPRGKDSIIEREGATLIRTGDGPVPLADILALVDTTYYPTRREFIVDVRTEIGYGPVPAVE